MQCRQGELEVGAGGPADKKKERSLTVHLPSPAASRRRRWARASEKKRKEKQKTEERKGRKTPEVEEGWGVSGGLVWYERTEGKKRESS